MDATITTIVAGGVLAAHGVGHALGWLPALGVAAIDGVSSRSWALTGVIGDGALARRGRRRVPRPDGRASCSRRPASSTGQPWWRQVAIASAATSLVATALYPQAFPASSTVGSVAANLVVLGGILVLGWGARAAV